MRNKTYEVAPRTILPTFRDTVCKDIVLLHPYTLFFDKDFVVKFFVGSFTVKQRVGLTTTVKVNGTFGANVQHINEHRWKAQHLFITNYDSNMAKIFPSSQAFIYYYTNERL